MPKPPAAVTRRQSFASSPHRKSSRPSPRSSDTGPITSCACRQPGRLLPARSSPTRLGGRLRETCGGLSVSNACGLGSGCSIVRSISVYSGKWIPVLQKKSQRKRPARRRDPGVCRIRHACERPLGLDNAASALRCSSDAAIRLFVFCTPHVCNGCACQSHCAQTRRSVNVRGCCTAVGTARRCQAVGTTSQSAADRCRNAGPVARSRGSMMRPPAGTRTTRSTGS